MEVFRIKLSIKHRNIIVIGVDGKRKREKAAVTYGPLPSESIYLFVLRSNYTNILI